MENKGLSNIISVIISIAIVGILGFIVYKNFIKINDNSNNNYGNTGTNNSLNDKDINKIGFEKYNLLYSKENIADKSFIFFKDNDVNSDNLSNQDKLYLLYSFLSDEDKNKTGNYDENCFLDKGVYTRDNYPDSCSKETFDKNILAERNSYYLDNVSVNYEDFNATSVLKCYIDSSKYNCYLNKTNLIIPKYLTIMKYDSSTLNNNTLEVFNYLLTVRKNNDSTYKKGIYSNSSATNKIDDLTTEIGDEINQELVDNLINQYKDKITKYKSTFVKVDNRYLWQKTEIVK